MKRFFLLLCVICGLHGISWGDFGESTEGKLCPVTFNHTPGVDCDSARVHFGYPSSNLYTSIKLFPLVADSSKLYRDSLNLDSIGGHYAELRYYERDAGSVSGYLLGEWLHEDPTPGDTIQRNASTHGASDVAALWGDTLTYLIAFRDSVNNAIADANKVNFHSSGDTIQRPASVFDPTSDNVAVVDSVTGVARVDSVRKVYILDSLDQTVTAAVDSNMIYRQTAYVVNDSNIARYVTRADYKDGVGGTGSYKDTILVLDGDTTTVEGVSITVRNASGTVVAIGETNVNGIEILNLDVATYTFSLQRIGIILNQNTTLTVSGDQTDTVWVTAYDVGSPPSANVTRVKGFIRTYGYQKTDRVVVSFSTHNKNLIDTTAGVFIDKIDEMTYSDTGFFQIDLIPSINLLSKQAGITKDSIRYDVKMYAPGRSVFEWQNIFIPDSSGAVWLEDLLE